MFRRSCILVLLISLLGLGLAIRQNVNTQQTMENKVEVKLKSTFPYLQQNSNGLLEGIQKEAYGYSQFIPLEQKAIALDNMTTKQLLSIDKTGQLDKDSLDYKPFFTREDYLEMQYHTGISNLDSISNILIDHKLQSTISKNLLLNTKVKLLNYLFGQTGISSIGCGFGYQRILPMLSNNLVELGAVFKSKIVYQGYQSDDAYKYKVFIDGKPLTKTHKFQYKTTPTQTGKHEYLLEIKDRTNKTVYKQTHYFFVENCKTNNYE